MKISMAEIIATDNAVDASKRVGCIMGILRFMRRLAAIFL